MKKQKYSLTANQRKEMRQRKSGTVKKNVRSENIEESEEFASDTEAVMGNKKFNLWLIPLLIAGVALIAIAIILPFSCNPYMFMDNPVAEIELNTGDVLTFEIYEDTCPIAATNFLFLARNKYFDNTIVFDIQQKWVRFGNFKSMTELVEDDKTYIDSLPGFYDNHKNKMGYRLKADSSSDAKRYGEAGMLVFNYKQSSCQFFISSDENLQSRLNGVDYTPTVVGRYLNDETLEAVKRIAALPFDENSPSTVWKNPNTPVIIKRVRLHNMDRKKWKNFHFEDYMNPEPKGSNSSFSDWFGGVND